MIFHRSAAAVSQPTEPRLAKEIAGVTDCKNKDHVNGGIFFLSVPDMAGAKRSAQAGRGQDARPAAGGALSEPCLSQRPALQRSP